MADQIHCFPLSVLKTNFTQDMTKFNRNDTINLLSKLSFRRGWNWIQVISSFYLSKWTRRPIQWGSPVSISFEPTTSCNLRCPECPSGLRSFTRPSGMLEMNFFRNMIDQLAPELLYLTFYFQGEPYLNPDFLDMVEYAHSKKIYTATSTNAHYPGRRQCATDCGEWAGPPHHFAGWYHSGSISVSTGWVAIWKRYWPVQQIL